MIKFKVIFIFVKYMIQNLVFSIKYFFWVVGNKGIRKYYNFKVIIIIFKLIF